MELKTRNRPSAPLANGRILYFNLFQRFVCHLKSIIPCVFLVVHLNTWLTIYTCQGALALACQPALELLSAATSEMGACNHAIPQLLDAKPLPRPTPVHSLPAKPRTSTARSVQGAVGSLVEKVRTEPSSHNISLLHRQTLLSAQQSANWAVAVVNMSEPTSANGTKPQFTFIDTPKAPPPTQKVQDCGVRTTSVSQ